MLHFKVQLGKLVFIAISTVCLYNMNGIYNKGIKWSFSNHKLVSLFYNNNRYVYPRNILVVYYPDFLKYVKLYQIIYFKYREGLVSLYDLKQFPIQI